MTREEAVVRLNELWCKEHSKIGLTYEEQQERDSLIQFTFMYR